MADTKHPRDRHHPAQPASGDPFTTEQVKPYTVGDCREWGLCVKQDVKQGHTIFEEQAMVQWTPLAQQTSRAEFDHWAWVLTQGGTTTEFLAWKWIYEWGKRQAFRDRDRLAQQQKQNDQKAKLPHSTNATTEASDVELTLVGWVMQLLHAFGLVQTQLVSEVMTPWATAEAARFHEQYVRQCQSLQVACQSIAEIEMAFRIVHWIVTRFQWVHYDLLSETPQSWCVLVAASRARPSCNPSAILLFKNLPTLQNPIVSQIQMTYVVALRELKKGEEITLAVFSDQNSATLLSRPFHGCGCMQGICRVPSAVEQSENKSALVDWRKGLEAWFHTGTGSCTPQIDMKHPGNLRWLIYWKTCEMMTAYPIPKLEQIQARVHAEMKNQNRSNVDKQCIRFWKDWTDFFPKDLITPNLRGSFRPAMPHAYLDKWWLMCEQLFHKIGPIVWEDESLLRKWNRAK